MRLELSVERPRPDRARNCGCGMSHPEVTDGRRLRGERTKAGILDAAVDIASVEGLEGLSIGTLARSTGVSKSGLFAHFGSKQELQLATIEAARERFVATVVEPALQAPPGIRRVRQLCDRWLGYAEGEIFPGGCFFAQTSAEFDNRPGPVRDRIAEIMGRWTRGIAASIREAQEAGEIKRSHDARQLAFMLNAIGFAANWEFQLQGGRKVFELARRGVRDQLEASATKSGRRKLDELER
jgi:AcrR family transcriptional regulator